MNDVYFACEKCRVMVDAGYRWAGWELEHLDLVRRRERVSAAVVLSATSYWSPPDEPDSKRLRENVLPAVRAFFAAHGEHPLTYGDIEEIAGSDPVVHFDWLDVGHEPELTPRYLVDGLGLRSWAQVLEWSKTAKVRPWWWIEADLKDAARRKFEELVGAAQLAVAADGASRRR